MRAKLPDREGDVVRDGVRTHYYVYGEGERTFLLMPTWSIAHAQHWKAQVPYLSRYFRVITVDGRGNGRSDRPGRRDRILTGLTGICTRRTRVPQRDWGPASRDLPQIVGGGSPPHTA